MIHGKVLRIRPWEGRLSAAHWLTSSSVQVVMQLQRWDHLNSIILHLGLCYKVMVTIIPVDKRPAGDDVLCQDSVTLHRQNVWDQPHRELLQFPHLKIYRAPL